MLKTHENLDIPLIRLLQENSKKWWAIVIMLKKLLDIADSVNIVLSRHQVTNYLLMKDSDQNDMRVIVNLLKPFAEAIYYFFGDKLVTISVVLFFQTLQDHLAAKKSDIQMIREMKIHMLQTLNNRYPQKQILFLKMCSFLDPRYKQRVTTQEDFDLEVFTEYVFNMWDNAGPESQQIFSPTQGQDLLTLTSSSVIGKNRTKIKKKSKLLDFVDDVVPHHADKASAVMEDLKRNVNCEIKKYVRKTLNKEKKETIQYSRVVED